MPIDSTPERPTAPDSDPLAGIDLAALTALVDAIVPDDDYPGASASGAITFLRRAFAADHPTARLTALLDRLAAAAQALGVSLQDAPARVLTELGDDDEVRWFAALVSVGYYADAGNGGNDGEKSWDMVGWRRGPAGWPADFVRDTDRRGAIDFAALAEHYDVVVIGSGAGGGAAASVFAADGRSVLVVESGPWSSDAELTGDHLRNARATYGFSPKTGPSAIGNPRVRRNGDESNIVTSADWGWSANASLVGGGTRVFGAQAWRFTEADFRMASVYGVPEGSALADWPICYDDLEPYYSRAEWAMGVAGSVEGDVTARHRSRPYPMAPMPLPSAALPLVAGAEALGIRTTAVPLLVNSEPYGGRAACVRCSECVGFACPIAARAGSHNTTLADAVATGNCRIVTETSARRLIAEPTGRIVAVELVTADGAGVLSRRVSADEFIVAAGAVESARLLLGSATDREPNGLGNNTDQVGRYLQAHAYAGATGIFADEVVDFVGPGPSIATTQFRHGNAGIIGGGMLANEFVSTPASTYTYLTSTGLIPWWGQGAKDGMRRMTRRMHRVVGPIQEVTSADSRVRLSPTVRDRLGIPVAQLAGSLHPEDIRALEFLGARAAEWLTASGAERVAVNPIPRVGAGPSGGQHQAGTCRMGDDPATSVVDPLGRVWGHDNVRVADGSVHVTNGGVNPVLSIVANALRIADLAVRG